MLKNCLYVLPVVLALAPTAVQAQTECLATCQFHATRAHGPGFVETVQADVEDPDDRSHRLTELHKYHVEVGGSGETLEEAYQTMKASCYDHASMGAYNMFRGTAYSPQILDSNTLLPPETKAAICTDAP